jgi:hypothetical protein
MPAQRSRWFRVEVLDIKNRCLFSKLMYKLLNEEPLHNEYLQNKTLSQVMAKPTDSQFWKGLIKIKEDFFTT